MGSQEKAVSDSSSSKNIPIQKEKTIADLPDQVTGLILGFVGNPTITENVCKRWKEKVGLLAGREILNGYMQSPRISQVALPFMPPNNVKPSDRQCTNIVKFLEFDFEHNFFVQVPAEIDYSTCNL
jgi:hypothetical protein